jgi:hypothetical protein
VPGGKPLLMCELFGWASRSGLSKIKLDTGTIRRIDFSPHPNMYTVFFPYVTVYMAQKNK